MSSACWPVHVLICQLDQQLLHRGPQIARQEGKSLPPVELVQVGAAYYCLDGHHRISVARAFGQPEIEAAVTVWQVEAAGICAATTGQPRLGLAGA